MAFLEMKLNDTQWPFEGVTHEREIARAIVFDDEGYYRFVRVERNDDFGNCVCLETAGGGIEPGEGPEDAVRRELREELGLEVEILEEIALVCDHYNLIRRRNIGHYFLCRVLSSGEPHRTREEKECWRLSGAILRFSEAVEEYVRCSAGKWGALLANRELPVLLEAERRRREQKQG